MNPTNKLSAFLHGVASQKFWTACCFVLAILGQSIIREPQPFVSFKPLEKVISGLNDTFYLFLKNPVSTAIGLGLIILSTIIYGRVFSLSKVPTNAEKLSMDAKNWSSWKQFMPWGVVNLGIYALVMVQLARHQYSNLLFWTWLATILVSTIIFWKNEKGQIKRGPSFSIMDGIWIIALFAFAISLGTYLLSDLPAGWITDEGPFWETARSLAIGEKSPPFFDFGVFSFPVASSMLQGWIMRWAGLNLWGWRFASVLPAAATVIPLYLLARELFDRRTAVVANVLMIVNPYFLTFSRLGYNNSQSLFPVTLCVYFLVIGIRRNSRFYLWLAGLSAGLGFYTYFAAWLGLVILVIGIAGFSWAQGDRLQKSVIPLATIMAGALMVLLPRVLYGTSGDTPMLLHLKIWETVPINTFYGESIFGTERISQAIKPHNFLPGDKLELFYDLPLYGIVLMRGLVLSTAVLFDPVAHSDHHIVFGLTGPGSSLFFVLGLGMVLAKIKDLRYFIPAIWFLAGFFLLGMLTSFPPRHTHMLPMLPALSLISSIGLFSFLDTFTSTNQGGTKSRLFWQKIVLAVILSVIAAFSFIQFFFLSPYIHYPINIDDYIPWLGRQIPQSATLLLVDHHPTEHSQLDESSSRLVPPQILLLTRANLEANPDQMKTWENFVVLIEPKDGRDFAEWMAQKIPGSTIQTAYVPGQRLRGYVVTDLQVNASMDISPLHGLRDLWNSPTRNILIVCGLGIAILWVKRKITKEQTSNTMGEIVRGHGPGNDW